MSPPDGPRTTAPYRLGSGYGVAPSWSSGSTRRATPTATGHLVGDSRLHRDCGPMHGAPRRGTVDGLGGGLVMDEDEIHSASTTAREAGKRRGTQRAMVLPAAVVCLSLVATGCGTEAGGPTARDASSAS